jgi:SAM-dependent methyltransferase
MQSQLKAKDLARAVVPHSRRAQLRELYNRLTWRLYLGTRHQCNCCDTRLRCFRSWVDDRGIVRPMCPRCGSLGRQRVDWLYLTDRSDLTGSMPTRLLHVAPEACFAQTLRSLPNISYLSVDYDSATAMERVDITAIPYPSASFDAVICNHVLEHVSDDLLAVRELLRVLRPGGWAMLQVPLDRGRETTFEDPGITEPRDRRTAFGQYDHVRAYGRDYAQRLASQGFEVSVEEPVKELPPETVKRFGLDVDEAIYLCRKPVEAQGAASAPAAGRREALASSPPG